MKLKSIHVLRAAALATLLFAAGHTFGATQSWSPPGETEVLRAMKSVRFDTEGVSRTYFDFYLGFGFTISIFLIVQAILLWQLAPLANSDSARAGPMLAALFLGNVASALVAWRFIFPMPAAFAAGIAVCIGLALVLRRSYAN
jgi:hypothetical protein